MTTTIFWCRFGFGKCFGASSRPHHWAGHHWLSYKTHILSHIRIQSRNGLLLLHRMRRWHFKKPIFLICRQLMRHPFVKLFHLSNSLQTPNDCRMADVEFFKNFLCSSKRISFNNCSQFFIVKFQWLATMLLIFKALLSFTKILEPPLHCTFISSSWAKCNADVARCLRCLTTILNLNEKVTWICSLSNILSMKKWKFLSCVLLFATLWTTQSMEFSRPEYWSG